jgi:hypothetical protein
MVGGPGDGHVVICVVGPDGRPPLTHWLTSAGGLARAPIYELETMPDSAPVAWRYCFRVNVSEVAVICSDD